MLKENPWLGISNRTVIGSTCKEEICTLHLQVMVRRDGDVEGFPYWYLDALNGWEWTSVRGKLWTATDLDIQTQHPLQQSNQLQTFQVDLINKALIPEANYWAPNTQDPYSII